MIENLRNGSSYNSTIAKVKDHLQGLTNRKPSGSFLDNFFVMLDI